MWSSWKRAAKARLIGAGLAVSLMSMAGVAAPSMAQDRLRPGFRDHQSVRRRCLAPLLGRAARCRAHERVHAEQDGPASQGVPRQASRRDGRLDVQGLQGSDLCALRRGALQCVRRGRLLSVRGEARRQHQPAVSDGQGRGRLRGQRRRRRQQIHGEHLQSARADRLAAGRRRGLHLRGRKVRRRLRPVRRGPMLPKHRGNDIPGLRQARAEGTDHLLLPDHRRQLAAARRATKSWGPTRATSPSSNIARTMSPTATRVRRSMSALLSARLRL